MKKKRNELVTIFKSHLDEGIYINTTDVMLVTGKKRKTIAPTLLTTLKTIWEKQNTK